MKDLGYVITEYKNSIVQKYDIACNCPEQLKNRIGYTEGAIDFHERENNPLQKQFFKESLNFLKSKVSKL